MSAKIICEHDLNVDSNGHVTYGAKCGRLAACILCRSCTQHCYGHSQMRPALQWRQFDYIESRGNSENE